MGSFLFILKNQLRPPGIQIIHGNNGLFALGIGEEGKRIQPLAVYSEVAIAFLHSAIVEKCSNF